MNERDPYGSVLPVLGVDVLLFLIALYGVHQGFLLPAAVKRGAPAATP
jgi:hypothetical protein